MNERGIINPLRGLTLFCANRHLQQYNLYEVRKAEKYLEQFLFLYNTVGIQLL